MTNHKGFTIIELLVVIVVIGVLASIAIVSYSSIKQRAQDAALRSDLTNVGKKLSLWMVEHSMSELVAIYAANQPGATAAWVAGDNADNDLTSAQLRWNTMSELPKQSASPNVTMELIAQYGPAAEAAAPGVNARMTSQNVFCITGAVRGGNYNYRPRSNIMSQYDKLLYYDSTFGRVVTMSELDTAVMSGKQIACDGHLQRWRAAVG